MTLNSQIVFFAISLVGFCRDLPAITPVRVGKIEGHAEVRAPAAAWRNAQEGMILEAGSVITTGFTGTVLISIAETTITLFPLSKLIIVNIDEKPDANKQVVQHIILALPLGRINAIIQPLVNGETSLTVHGPKTSCTAQGTTFEYDTETITVLQGRARFTGKDGRSFFVDKDESSDAF
ncbi:MAG: hypothetical protein LBD22_07240 [Spirochaetaceae bacterium]|jgi:hypothetical protein|nr:hypothetical protein [Spirochaetaceae bacterium]